MVVYSYPASVTNLNRLAALVAAMPEGLRADLTLTGDRVLLRVRAVPASRR